MFVHTCDQKSWRPRFTPPFSLAVFSRPRFNLCMRLLAAVIHSQNDWDHGYSTTFGIVLLWDQAIAELVKYLDLISTYLGPANIPEANKAEDIGPDETIFTIPIVAPRCSHLPCCKPLVFGLAISSVGEQSSYTFRGVDGWC